MNTTDTSHYLRINEIKQYLYCPRMSFYALCMGLERETDLSRGGIAEEKHIKQRMRRRKYALHAVTQGERHFDVFVVSHRLQLVGKVDEVVTTPNGVHLIDYKDTRQDFGYWRLQLMAYRLCMEEAGETVLGTWVYTIPDKNYHAQKARKGDQQQLEDIIKQLRLMVIEEICPPPADHPGKCRSCQYARFCNDVF